MVLSPGAGVALMMNNYFHDVATALLAASAFSLWALAGLQDRMAGEASPRFFLAAYERMILFARISLVWIVLGGIPRTIFYRDFEWANAAGRGQIPALVVKHILMFILVGLGAWGWVGLRRRRRALAAAFRTGADNAGGRP